MQTITNLDTINHLKNLQGITKMTTNKDYLNTFYYLTRYGRGFEISDQMMNSDIGTSKEGKAERARLHHEYMMCGAGGQWRHYSYLPNRLKKEAREG